MDFYGKECDKGYDVGFPNEIDIGFCISDVAGAFVSAVLQHGGYDYCRKMAGVNSLAAVGSTGSINFMVIGFCVGVCSGFAIPVAQKFGAGDYTALRKFVANSVWISAVFAAVMTVVVCALCMNILRWMNTPSDIIEEAYEYIIVIFLEYPLYFYIICCPEFYVP